MFLKGTFFFMFPCFQNKRKIGSPYYKTSLCALHGAKSSTKKPQAIVIPDMTHYSTQPHQRWLKTTPKPPNPHTAFSVFNTFESKNQTLRFNNQPVYVLVVFLLTVTLSSEATERGSCEEWVVVMVA